MGRDYQDDIAATVFLIRFSQDKHANLRGPEGEMLLHHVKQQQWAAVAIDFAIVVLGVVIGIQTANC